ncbi:surface lipoprotein assembly modifier [Loktanella sp. Alg231-35]|uniref:surface lipoprotein assembly modifier n=1 Tax=Loktanella sp. Alg231-35 TaxID=1922220 RepID=UPI001F1FB61D|nr:surface lipoprotein assembly modifier [Loktanella sp. Alg231-35]
MRRGILALAAALFCSSANAQTQIDVPIAQARVIMAQAAVGGDPALAVEIANAILAQDPDDRDALVVLAVASPRLGDPKAGRAAGARAWRLSESPAQRYEAARVTALAAANAEELTLATFWLRLALISAPDEAERTRTINDARAVAQRNPWSTQLSFSLVPSNNVNGGAEDEDCSSLGVLTCTLSEDAVALTGWRGSFGFGTQYRLQESPTSRTIASLQYQAARVWITEDTSVPNDALSTNSLQLSLRHDRALENGTVSGTLSRAQVQYRDLDLSAGTTEDQSYDIWRVGIDRRFPLAERTSMSLSYRRELLIYGATGIGEVNRNSVSAGLTYGLQNGDQISGTATFTDSVGDLDNYTSQDQSLRILYGWSEPIGPIKLSAGGGIRWADYPVYAVGFNIDERQDTTVFAEANIGFPEVSFAGFTPGLRVDLSKVDSNVSRFDRTTFSVGFTINSQF